MARMCRRCGYEVYPRERRCPRCGAPLISSRKKRARRNKIIFLSVIVVFVIAIACILAIISVNKIDKKKSMTDAVETQKTEPYSGTANNEVKSEPANADASAHSHEWLEATCENPKTCSLCNETEGAPLGHTVEMGVCDRCGEFANFAVLKQVLDDMTVATKNDPNALNDAIDRDLSDNDLYLAAQKDVETLNKAKNDFQKVINDCGDFEYLSEIKNAAQHVVDVTPTSISGGDIPTLIDFLKKEKAFLQAVSESINAMKPYAADIEKAKNNSASQ